MKRIFALCLGLLLSVPLYAAESKTFTWTLPSTRVNGDSLPLAQVVGSVIECGTVSGGPYDFVTYNALEADLGQGGVARSFTSPEDFTPNTYFCRIGVVSQNPDDPGVLPDLDPGEYTNELSFSVAACDTATCGASAPGNFAIS